jgi:hypothetical protein
MTEAPSKQEAKRNTFAIPHSQSLAIPATRNGVLQFRSYGEAIEIAKMFAVSGMVPQQYANNTAAVLVAIQMGSELGLSPMSSLQSIAVINGRPAIYGDAMLALVMNHHEFVDIAETEGDGFAKCVVKRKNRTPTERVFTIDDARKANLWNKQGTWTQYPKRMLQLRARSFALRDAFPDALRGVISSEEARDYEPNVIDGGTPNYDTAADIPEGTHSLRSANRVEQTTAKQKEPPHDPKTGEVIENSQSTQKAHISTVTADPNAGF